MDEPRPRVLVLVGNVAGHHPVVASLGEYFRVDVFDSIDAAMEARWSVPWSVTRQAWCWTRSVRVCV